MTSWRFFSIVVVYVSVFRASLVQAQAQTTPQQKCEQSGGRWRADATVQTRCDCEDARDAQSRAKFHVTKVHSHCSMTDFDWCLQPGEASPCGPPSSPCNDKVDNDGDGWIDYPDDRGCESAQGKDELNDENTQRTTQCSDEKDNDKDGKIDGNDQQCPTPDTASESEAPVIAPMGQAPAAAAPAPPATPSLTQDRPRSGLVRAFEADVLNFELGLVWAGFFAPKSRIDVPFIAPSPALGLTGNLSLDFELSAQVGLYLAGENNWQGLRLAGLGRVFLRAQWGLGLEAHAHFIDLKETGSKATEIGFVPSLCWRGDSRRWDSFRASIGYGAGWVEPERWNALAHGFVTSVSWLFP